MASKIALLSLLAFACVVSGIVYPTRSYDGWEVITLDTPSYLFYIQHSFSEEQLYVFGGDHLRVVTTGKNFTVQDHVTAIDWHQEFVSLHIFHNGSDLWAIGPTNPGEYTAHPEGYDLPIALAGPDWHTLKVDGLQGFILYSVYVDERNTNDILSYMVGWIPIAGGVNETVNQVALGVVRLHLNFNAPYASRQFTFDYDTDVVPLAFNTFSIYASHYKPQVHFDNDTNIVIVVDPGTDTIYTVQAGPGNSKMTALQSQNMHQQQGVTLSSSLFHPDTNLLYIGLAAQGTGNGSVLAYSISDLKLQHSITFSGFLSNPKAIAIDEPTDTIYVGFDGGNAVVKLDYLLQIQGWQRVPDHLTHIQGARVGMGHVYFITNEQHSKVARVRKQDFCPSLCPHWGYCNNGKCECDPRLKMSSDKKTCEIPKQKSDKGAAAALGVLFAIFFILAIIGWFLWYRQRKSGYATV